MSKRKLFASLFILVIAVLCMAQSSQYARRIFPIFSNPSTPCARGSVWYHMLDNKFLICTNNGAEEIAVGISGGVIPIANSTTTGRLSNTDWVTFNSKQNALGFTPENLANKNASNGYAGLSGGKISGTQVSEVISSINLTDYSTTSGSGSTAIRSTISAAANNDVLAWNGSNWINQSQLMSSVFGRSGTVTAQSGDYTASQITNAFDVSGANLLSLIAAPSNPSAGFLVVWADTTDTILKAKNPSGVVSTTVKSNTCSGTDKVSAITSAGVVICTTDQTGGGGGGGGNILSLNGLTAADQTFSTTDDSNIDLAINSSGATHNISVAWLGTLAKNRMVSTTVHTDQANTYSAFAQTFQAGSLFKLTDPTNNTKIAQFDLSNISSGTTRTVNIPDANSTTIQTSTAPANNFVVSVSNQGILGFAQPSFSNLSGSATDAQVPNSLALSNINNLVSNGFVKTSSSDGTLFVDTTTYLSSIANNSITGAMIALGSDAQGDIMFYNGTDWVRLAAGINGQFLKTQGTGANPVWASTAGDMTLSAIQTVTGAKTFDPTKLIIGSVSVDPSVVVNSFYVDSDDGKLYFGVDSSPDFWGEVFIGGQSLINLVTNVTGILPMANGGLGVALTDPNADRILFWDDSAGQYQYLTLGTNISITGTTLNVTGGGSGDFVGPASSTDNAVVRFDSTTGKLGQNSGVIVDDSNNISGIGSLATTSLTVGGAAITNNIVQNSQSAAYTTVLSDAGKHLYHPSADTTARTYTIDSNANVAYPVGTAITFVNDCSAGTVTISITSDTLVLAGAGTTGSRTLAACGVATAIKVTSTRWIINGTGLS